MYNDFSKLRMLTNRSELALTIGPYKLQIFEDRSCKLHFRGVASEVFSLGESVKIEAGGLKVTGVYENSSLGCPMVNISKADTTVIDAFAIDALAFSIHAEDATDVPVWLPVDMDTL